MVRSGLAVAVLALCLWQGADAFYSTSSSVVSLTASNFDSKIKSGGVWLVEVMSLKRDLEAAAAFSPRYDCMHQSILQHHVHAQPVHVLSLYGRGHVSLLYL